MFFYLFCVRCGPGLEFCLLVVFSRYDKKLMDLIVCRRYNCKPFMIWWPNPNLVQRLVVVNFRNSRFKHLVLVPFLYSSKFNIIRYKQGKQRDNLTRMHPNLNLQWLDTSVGNQDVFLVKREDLAQSKKPAIQKAPRGPAVGEPRPKSGNHKRFRRE